MCKHNIIGIKKSDKDFMEQKGFHFFFDNQEIHYYCKTICDCNSVVGFLADYEGKFEDYILDVQNKEEKWRSYITSKEYRLRKKQYIKIYNKYLKIVNGFTAPIEKIEEKMMDEIWDKELSVEEEAKETEKVKKEMEQHYIELNKNKEYVKARKQFEDHINDNKELLDIMSFEACEKSKEDSEDDEKLRKRLIVEGEELLKELRILKEKFSIVYFGQIWNEEDDTLKEKKQLGIDEMDIEELLHLKLGEIITIV